MIMYTHGMAELLKLQTESTSLFLGRAVARVPISGFVILPVQLYFAFFCFFMPPSINVKPHIE